MRKNKKKNKKSVPKITLGFVDVPLYLLPLIVAGVIAIVYLTIQTATSGARLSYLEQEEAKLMQENKSLNDDLVMQSSLSKMAKSAEDLGYRKPEKVVYTNIDEVMAKLP